MAGLISGLAGPAQLIRSRRMLLNTLGVAKVVPGRVRPSAIIQRRAIQKGLFGPSHVWRAVAVVLLLRGPIEGIIGRRSEPLGKFRVGTGHSIRVNSFAPTSRKQRKESGITKKKLYDQAWAELQDPNFRP